MSVDLWLKLKGQNGAEVVIHDLNITYNLSPMWRACDWDFHDLEGRTGADIGEGVAHVVQKLKADPDKFRAMNPPNLWGTYEQCLDVFEKLLAAIKDWPDAVVGTWL